MATTLTATGITFPDATTQTTAATGGGGSYVGTNYEAFGSSGTFTVPTGITKIVVQVWAGGGGGKGGLSGVGGQKGGTCGFGEAVITGLTPGATVTVTVGAGGAGGNGGNGATGGTSSFGTYISCTGGAGGNGTTQAFPGSATFSGVAQILTKNNYITYNTTLFTAQSATLPSISLGGGTDGANGITDPCSSAYGGGGGGGGYGAGGGGGTNGGAVVYPNSLAGVAFGAGVDGTNGNIGRVGGAGGGNGIASNGGAGATGSTYGGGGGGGGGFVLVMW